jgi:hypothetical protein
VRCEACHGPGGGHVEAVRSRNSIETRRGILNPGRGSAAEILQSCGGCHRMPPRDPSGVDWKDPAMTRFQPVGLSQSLCYKKSEGRFSCLTCHDPHSDSSKDANFYEKKCAGCHHEARRRPAAVCESDCTKCHMPRVEAFPHISFSNHWIGIYGGSNRLRPSRAD